ncbi:phenylalanyl-tRNA synthase subunit beta [Alkalihalobacillus alcalophilus ATCC 27647 = CGMCC 1.3604]|uniref:Phenylalanine--tRNA ligase beta subunit n=1 Tax=Alkalihalobacillus alcalophilus ATCC 27647 = CGMCC 1.3604 TaxID=1218173 RepID=A0A094WP97_ALKAL|nr:phenylalanine--tRNA ligase subunit beta [Alkalihalobacillus alcalophilus]KGA97813.1 phenylalanyl-tRNA synthase subunit beta [Alkalihalobacillus alcalophilus ATCC 27647 = CGMCC 1.3604]MED1564064.1 phenylalanine--tRNA ligase subunit beta [Alkalihalobacillus alcalophilus]THG88935.1 phenylalanyl-tRNA synthase subunit beta [Alkalihalobacillus alcalophilus ATCC 27647 = CGMCC 1.3604]
MLVSYKWLQEYVDLSEVTAAQIAEKMTRGGIEIDFIHELNKGVSGIVVGYVKECQQHPNADKLNVCKVDIGGDEIVQIVCGARNVAAGQYVIVAKVGAVLPGNFKIKKAKLRGEVSMGMICSLQELGIDGKLVQKEFEEGIYVFQDEVPVGTDAISHLNLDDHVLELDLTPNRSDCLNMLGVAYEVSSLYNLPVQLPQVDLSINTTTSKSNDVEVTIEDTDANPYYGAIVIKDVKVGKSPLWLQNRLMAAGIRPISNVVDVTNYVLLEYGQPLHAFDYDRFGSKEVVVRKAKEEEKMLSLDGVERTLSEDHLVITNGIEPMAIAGVMGGKNSEVQDDTTTILLEAAYFNPTSVRKTSKDLGLRSDSSARFEKGVDKKRVREAAKRAATLIQELAGGQISEEIVEVDHLSIEEPKIKLELTELNNRLGLAVNQAEVANILKQLRFDFEVNGDTFIVTGPTRRSDIQIAEDLYEEVARIYGYDNIPTTLPDSTTTQGQLSEYQSKRRRVRRYLEGAGLNEVITYSLTSPTKAKGFAEEENDHLVRLAMPMSDERSTMRTSLIPHLFDVVRYNLNRKNHDIAIFEIGSIFKTDEATITKQPVENEMLALSVNGLWHEHSWQGEKKAVDFYVLKGIVEGLAAELGLSSKLQFKLGQKPDLHPGRTAIIELAGKEIGYIGQVHPKTAKEQYLKEIYVGQLDLVSLLNVEPETVTYQTLPRFPAIVRDIALVVDEKVLASELENTIVSAGGELLKGLRLFDLYQGEHLEDGKKSLAFSLTYLDPERTLTDEEVTEKHEEVLNALAETGATLRS